ncbi:MAG TPA: Lrp/AsnC family transcriptional regulator [Actinomycetota bacterium]|nr:Lrp/AsnC family transcriptional regulator [Actinomycetota bacterium]
MVNLEVDELDFRIIEQLQEDGRRPYTTIAKALGVSEGTVRQRVGRLIRRGVIQIVAVADPTELGFGVVATIGVRVRGRSIQDAARRIAELPEVAYLAIVTGSVDMLVEVVCRDSAHLLRLISEDIVRLPGVECTDTFIFLKRVKETYRWPYSAE